MLIWQKLFALFGKCLYNLKKREVSMENNCNREDRSCGDNCSETRKEVGKIMAVFGLIIAALAYYIISNGILEKAFR
jgi:hypothetical protein